VEIIKKYIKCCFGGMLCGNGCFVLPYKATAEYEATLWAELLCMLAAFVIIYAGCVMVLPENDSHINAKQFVFFAFGMLLSVYIGK